MTKKSPETLLAVLDHIASGVVPFTKAATMADVRPGTFFDWCRKSDDPSLFVSWRGSSMSFAEAVKHARREALSNHPGRTDQTSSNIADNGVNVVHHYHHVEVHLIDDRAPSSRHARLERQLEGTLKDADHEAPFEAGVLDAEVSGKSQRMMTTPAPNERPIGTRQQEPAAPKVFLAPTPRPGDDIDLEEMLGPEPVTAASEAAAAEYVSAAEPEVVPDEREHEAVTDTSDVSVEPEVAPDKPTPRAFDDFPDREPRSELERFLFAQLAASRAKKAQAPSTDSSATEGHSAGSAAAPQPACAKLGP